MGHTKRISHSRLARASANMPYKIEKTGYFFLIKSNTDVFTSSTMPLA